MREELKVYNMAKEHAIADDPAQGQVLNVQKLVQRVSELEDLVHEFKN